MSQSQLSASSSESAEAQTPAAASAQGGAVPAAGVVTDCEMCDHSTQTTTIETKCGHCSMKSLELCQKAVNLMRETFIKIVEEVSQEVF